MKVSRWPLEMMAFSIVVFLVVVAVWLGAPETLIRIAEDAIKGLILLAWLRDRRRG